MSIEESRRHVRNACVAGLVSAGVTLVLSVGGLFGFTLWELVDAVLIVGLTYGIWKFSRICAVVMLAYFVIGRVMLWAQTGMPRSIGLLVALVFIYFYGQAVRATFGYHKTRRSSTAAEPTGSS